MKAAKRIKLKNVSGFDSAGTGIQNAGAQGTDKIALKRHLNLFGQEDDGVLKWAYLSSLYQRGHDLLDEAVLEHAALHDCQQIEKEYLKVDEIPFDFERRRISVVLEQMNGNQLLICKGTMEEMLNQCSFTIKREEDQRLYKEKEKIVAIDRAFRDTALHTMKRLNEDGLRVLLVAIKEHKKRPANYAVEDESNMTLVGFLGFQDPVKPSLQPPSVFFSSAMRHPYSIPETDNRIRLKN